MNAPGPKVCSLYSSVQVWAGSYNTVAVTESGEVMVCGLNNYNQMGLAEGLTFYMPVVSPDLSKRRWQGVAIGQHHAVAQVMGEELD